jgi:hypothetical protein
MSRPTLEERVAALENQVEQLWRKVRSNREPVRDDRKSTVGMFADDLIMKEIIDEGRKIRERDREIACDDQS